MNPNWKELDQQVTVSGQIHPADVAHIAAAGYRAIVCNRPDGEAPDQTDYNEIAEACAQNGVVAKYIPLADRAPTPYAVTSFADVMRQTRGRVFAYCNTGARCELIWRAVKESQMAGA